MLSDHLVRPAHGAYLTSLASAYLASLTSPTNSRVLMFNSTVTATPLRRGLRHAHNVAPPSPPPPPRSSSVDCLWRKRMASLIRTDRVRAPQVRQTSPSLYFGVLLLLSVLPALISPAVET